jgi:hypothetical protein
LGGFQSEMILIFFSKIIKLIFWVVVFLRIIL